MQRDCEPAGFEWIDGGDADDSVLPSCARAPTAMPPVLVVCNFTPVVRHDYRVGVPRAGALDASGSTPTPALYGGSNVGNSGGGLPRAVAVARPSGFARR